MSWLSSFWDHNRNFLGNALKNISPAAFLIPGVGPLAAAGIAGVGSALGSGIEKGGTWGGALSQGLQGAGEAYLGSKLTGGQGDSLSRLKHLFMGGGSGSPSAQAARESVRAAAQPLQFTPSSTTTAGGALETTPSGLAVPGVQVTGSALSIPAPSVAALPTPNSPGFISKALQFAKDNPMAAALGLQGAGQLAALPAENRLKAAQQRQLELENQAMQAEQDRQQALQPLWDLLFKQYQKNSGGYPIAPNPYSRGAYGAVPT